MWCRDYGFEKVWALAPCMGCGINDVLMIWLLWIILANYAALGQKGLCMHGDEDDTGCITEIDLHRCKTKTKLQTKRMTYAQQEPRRRGRKRNR